jgi:hypothetical protein
MYRRRRQQRDKIAFGFDSFLDIVANVIGIIIRLILVAWVGGRSYHALMQWRDEPQAPASSAQAAPRPEDHHLSRQIQETQAELDAARARLLAHAADLQLVEKKRTQLEAQLVALSHEQRSLAQQRQALERAGDQNEKLMRLATLSLEELRRRQQALLADLKNLEARPAPKKELRYRTPVSRTVQADEAFFECRAGRVAYIDMPAFLQEVQAGLDGKVDELRTRWKVDAATRPVGAFQLRYVVEREASPVDAVGGAMKPRGDGGFRYGVTGWTVEPVLGLRGEALEVALAPGSQFRRMADALDSTTVVTFWVYPDSFELFRRLRDALYERGLEVAGRPLPEGAPIAASRHGTASRGQ